ncbi:MAG: hypothetical protein A6F72_03055 [Cycloclasticus sp. symbiont of Poecilosclerida sp. N]|nr:MAG: hypothetical protein A6F72_03055 [Cycloclasticus sp. symbiont of Poecilosclerida sp. N]
MTEALQCLGSELEKNMANNLGAYAFLVRDIADGTVNSDYDGPLADAGRVQMISILTAHTKPRYGLVMDRFPLLFEQTNNEQIGINRFGLPSTKDLNTYLSMLTAFTNANRQSKGMPAVKTVMPLIIDGAFTRYDSSHIRSKGYGQNAGYRGSSEEEQSASIDRGKSGSERSITLVVNIIDPKTNTVVGTEGFDLKFYSNSKTARFRVAISDFYYGFSNTDVRVETVHAAQQILLEAGAIWILDNAFGSMVDFSPCFDTNEKQALGRDSRNQQAKKSLPSAVAVQQLKAPEPLPAGVPTQEPTSVAAPASLLKALPEQNEDATRIAQAEQVATQAPEQNEDATRIAQAEQAATQAPEQNEDATRIAQAEQVATQAPEQNEDATRIAQAEQAATQAPEQNEDATRIAQAEQVATQAPEQNEDATRIAQAEQVATQAPEQNEDATRIAQTEQEETQANADDAAQWQVAVGIFVNSKSVAAVSKQLNAAGYKPNYSIVPSGLGKATQIWLGPYTKKETAKETSVNLERITGEKGYVSKQTF